MVQEMPFRLKLINAIPDKDRCEHLRLDGDKVFCSKGYSGGPISEQRQLICDYASLQLWCLDSERKGNCIWYNGGPFRDDANGSR